MHLYPLSKESDEYRRARDELLKEEMARARRNSCAIEACNLVVDVPEDATPHTANPERAGRPATASGTALCVTGKKSAASSRRSGSNRNTYCKATTKQGATTSSTVPDDIEPVINNCRAA